MENYELFLFTNIYFYKNSILAVSQGSEHASVTDQENPKNFLFFGYA